MKFFTGLLGLGVILACVMHVVDAVEKFPDVNCDKTFKDWIKAHPPKDFFEGTYSSYSQFTPEERKAAADQYFGVCGGCSPANNVWINICDFTQAVLEGHIWVED